LWIVEDACEALGATYADAARSARAATTRSSPSTRTKQMTTGEGGAVVCVDAADKARIDSERNQGRAPNMDWLDHDRLGFNYRLSDIAAAIGVAQLGRLQQAARCTCGGGGDVCGCPWRLELTLPAPLNRSWFVYVVQLPPAVDRDDHDRQTWGRWGIETKPYLPAIHLMSFYRERFGWREGQFPVCEDVSRRSLALPFFPGISESQVQRVAEALTQLLPG